MWRSHHDRWQKTYATEKKKKFPGIVFVPYFEKLSTRNLILCSPVDKQDELTVFDEAEVFIRYMGFLLWIRNNSLLETLDDNDWSVGTLSFPNDVIDYKSKLARDWILEKTRKDPCDKTELCCKDILKPEALLKIKELRQEFFVTRNL